MVIKLGNNKHNFLFFLDNNNKHNFQKLKNEKVNSNQKQPK